MDLVAEDETRVGTVYFLMSEDEVRRKVALPWMNFGSDGAAVSAEGVFLKSNAHPRAYGNFARVLGRYVRDEKRATLEDAIHRMTGHPAAVLNLGDRGCLKAGQFADVVVFDPGEDPGPCDLHRAAPVRDGRIAGHRERRARARERRADRGAARTLRARPCLEGP